MYKALIIILTLSVYQFTGAAGLHPLPRVSGEAYSASCVFVAEALGSERMRESQFCSGG